MSEPEFYALTDRDVDRINLAVDPAWAHEATDLPGHTWKPISLAQAEAAPPEPPNIAGVIYPDRTQVWSGEPETLKSMVAMAIALDQIRKGAHAAYIDFENGIRETTSRLRALGATDDDLRRFLYYQPEEPLADDIKPDMLNQLAQYRPSFITIDSYTSSLALHGFDPNKSIDVEQHHKLVITPLRAHGAGIVLLDHLVKNRESRGRYSIGSERKIGVCDVHISFDIVVPLSRGHHGVVKLITHKDRPGYLHRPKAAQVRFDSTTTGDLTWKLEPAEDHEQPAPIWRPTIYMERVSRYLSIQNHPVPLNTIEEGVSGMGKHIRKAVEVLLIEGYANESKGPRGARLIEHVQDYRELSDQARNGPDLVSTSSTWTDTDLVSTSSNGTSHNHAEKPTSSHLVSTSSPTSEPSSSNPVLPPTGGDGLRDEVSDVPKTNEINYETEPEPEWE